MGRQHDTKEQSIAASAPELYLKAKAVIVNGRGRSGGNVYMVQAREFLALKQIVAKIEGWKITNPILELGRSP